MPSHLASQPTFIKIKYKDSIRKVQVAQQPAPAWSKLSTAIRARFAISDQQSIGLRYLDPDGDLITVSSQVELDELWEEIRAGAKLKEKDGIDRKLIKLDLVIIDSEPKSEFVLLYSSSDVDQGETTALVDSPASDALSHAILDSPVGGPISPSHHSVTVESIDAPTEPVVAPIEQSVAPTDSIVDPAARQPLSETQSAPDPPEEVVQDDSPPPSARANAPLGMEHLPALIAVAVGSVAPELQRTLGSYAQLMVDATSQLNNACRVVAERLQDPAQPAPSSQTPTASNLFGSRAEPHGSAPTANEPDDRHVPRHPNPGQPNPHPEIPLPPPNASARPYHESFAMPGSRFDPPHLLTRPFHAHRFSRMANGFGHPMPPFGSTRGHHPHSLFRMPSNSPPHRRMASPPPLRRMASPPLHHHRMASPPPLHQRKASPPMYLDEMPSPIVIDPSPVLASRQVLPGTTLWEQLMARPQNGSKTGSSHAPSVLQSQAYAPSPNASSAYVPSVCEVPPRHSPPDSHPPRHSPSVYLPDGFAEFERPVGDGNEACKDISARGLHVYGERGNMEQERENALFEHAQGGRFEGLGDWKEKRAGGTGRKKRCKGGIQWGNGNEEGVSDQLKFPVMRPAGSVEIGQDGWGVSVGKDHEGEWGLPVGKNNGEERGVQAGKKNAGVGGGRRGGKIPPHFSWDD